MGRLLAEEYSAGSFPLLCREMGIFGKFWGDVRQWERLENFREIRGDALVKGNRRQMGHRERESMEMVTG